MSFPPLTRQASTGATCRICYGGSEDGHLFKPCRCSGSVKYVHVECLEKWRESGPAKAKFECPQCHYRYNLSRLTISGWLDRRWVVPVLTLVLFCLAWALCVMLSFLCISVGMLSPSDPDRGFEIWSLQNMLNGFVIVGILGLVYSLVIDGFGMLAVFNIHPSSLHGLCTVCILDDQHVYVIINSPKTRF